MQFSRDPLIAVQTFSCYNISMPYKDIVKQRKWQLERVTRNRKQWLSTHPRCINCGSNKNIQVDHVDPGQKVSHRIWSWSKERREKELEKCQPLCLVCHKEKTKAEISIAIEHGTHDGYANHGCRCDECRRGTKEYMRRWRSK